MNTVWQIRLFLWKAPENLEINLFTNIFACLGKWVTSSHAEYWNNDSGECHMINFVIVRLLARISPD